LQIDDTLTPTPPKKISQTDPAARWTAAPGGPAFYAYSTNYLIDTDNGIIMDVEATAAHRMQEVWSTKTMIERVQDRSGHETKRLIGDTAYGSAAFLGWMVNEKGIEPHVPVWDKGKRSDGTFSRSDFVFDEDNDCYTCPNGKELKRFRRNFKVPRTGVTKSNEIKYKASKMDCVGLSLEGAVSSECGVPQSCAQHPRVSTRCCKGGETNAGLSSNTTTTKAG